jgi:hypothetical protein
LFEENLFKNAKRDSIDDIVNHQTVDVDKDVSIEEISMTKMAKST